MYLDEKKTTGGKWWICAGLVGITITAAFIATILYLSSDNLLVHNNHRIKPPLIPQIRPRFKHVHEIEQLDSIIENNNGITEIDIMNEQQLPTTVKPPKLSSGPDPITVEEILPKIKTTIRKKSEAVYPTDWTDDLSRPVVIDPKHDFIDDFHLPGLSTTNGYNKEKTSSSTTTTSRTTVRKLTPPSTPPVNYLKEYEYEEDSENPLITFLQKRLKDVYEAVNGGGGTVNTRKNSSTSTNSDWLDVLDSVNESISKNNISIVMNKLREMYYNTSTAQQDLSLSTLIYPSRQTLLNNASSLVSFGLLAVDLFLLHNVQQIAIAEEHTIGEKMKRDPEVVALSALFLPPEKINELGRSTRQQQQQQQQQNLPESTTTDRGIIQELMEFVQSGVRAAVNLGKVYRKTTAVEAQGRSTNKPSPLDCIWTLYCRNLDKTARLNGPYGFLAKMNSLALRLMMGEFPVDQAVEKLFVEYTRGWGTINCQKLFPRCGAEEARQVVIATALGENRL